MDFPEHVKTLAASGALFVANHSGGKDNQILTINLLKVVPACNILVVHASLDPLE